MRCIPILAAGLFLSMGAAHGGDAASTPPPAAEPQAEEPQNPEEFSKVRGLFDVDLPKTVPKSTFKIIIHPHFGDFTKRSYLRIPVGVRFGINDHTELNAEVEGYITHGLKKKAESVGQGLSNLRFGAKYEWQHWLKGTVDASTGVNLTFPVGRPPLELEDGHNHFAPYVVFSKILPNHPKFTPFVSLGADFLWKSNIPGSFGKNQPASNGIGIAPGFFYDLGTIKYTLVASYATTAIVGKGSKNYVSLNPSVLWQLPPSLTFHSKGKWIFGLGLKESHGPDGNDFGTSVKLRGEIKLSKLFGRPAPPAR